MSYPTKKSHKCKKISSLDQSHADSQLRIFCNNFLWWLLTIFPRLEKFIFLSFFEEKRFVYLQKGSLSQGQLEFFCWQMYSKWEEKYFYSLAYDRMRLLKNFLDVSISLPSKNSNATDANHRSSCECVQNGSTLFHLLHIRNFSQRWCLFLWWRGLLYSIGREAERAHRLYQYFERVGAR